MKHLFTLSEWLRGKLVKLVNLVMQFLKLTKLTKLTEQIFAESLKSLKSLMSIFSSRGVKDVRVSLGQQRTNIQRISNLSLTPNRFFTRFAAVFALVFVLGVGNVWGYTITFNTSGSVGIATGEDYVSSATETAYVAATSSGMQFGSTGKGGAYEMTMSSTGTNKGQIKASKITLNGLQKFSSKGGDLNYEITFTDNSNTSGTVSASATASNHDISLTNYTSKTIQKIKFSSSAANKRFYLAGFEVVAVSSCNSLIMSSVTATPGNGQIALSWPAVANASSYTVSCKVKSSGAAAGTAGSVTGTTTKSCTITGLANGTEYTWSVMPVGTGSYCAENTPATGDATPNQTRTITYYDKDGSHSTTLADGTNIATALNALYGVGGPTSCNTTDYNYFVGWKDGNISGTATSVTLLSTEVVNATTAAKSYYAVWSDTEPADYSTTYTSNVTLPSSGTYASSASLNIGSTSGITAVKLGKSEEGGSGTFSIPSGTTKIYLHAAGWNGKSATLTLSTSVGSISPSNAQDLTSNTGVANNSPFTLATPLSNDFFEYTLSGVTSAATITLETGSERGVIWGVNAISGSGSAKYITTCCTSLGSINGSFFWSTLFEPLSPDKFRSHVLLCNHLFSSSHHRIPHHLIYTMYISRDFGFF